MAKGGNAFHGIPRHSGRLHGYGMVSGLEALRLTAMGAAGSPESLPLSPTVGAVDCGCGGRESKTKMHFNSLVCHVLSNYYKKSIDVECVLALFCVSSQ